MALLRNASIRNSSGAYERLFDSDELGLLASKAQSAVISSGNELECVIINMVGTIDNLDEFLRREVMPEGVFLVRKQQMKKCRTLDFLGAEPDFIVFRRRSGKQSCHVVELKDGHVFDTKKASAERQAMHGFIERNAQHLQYRVSSHFCAFNQDSPKAIRQGFKNKIALQEAMTGRAFCDLLEIDYDAIVERRKADGPDNVSCFLAELLKIESVRQDILKLPGENCT